MRQFCSLETCVLQAKNLRQCMCCLHARSACTTIKSPQCTYKCTYLPQTRKTSMLQAAAARATVPLHRIRWVTCSHPNNIHITRVPHRATNVLDGKRLCGDSKQTTQNVSFDMSGLINRQGTKSITRQTVCCLATKACLP